MEKSIYLQKIVSVNILVRALDLLSGIRVSIFKMLSDTAFLTITLILFFFTIIYWIGLLIYIFYDDLEMLLTSKSKSVKIVEEEPIYTPQISKLRRPTK